MQLLLTERDKMYAGDEDVINKIITIYGPEIKKKFENEGYKLPDIVFWNVASRNNQQPVTKNDNGVVLVSGCTPRLFSMVASGEMNPYAFMMEVIGSDRYAKIVA